MNQRRNIKLNNMLYTVITQEEYVNYPNLYGIEYTAILFEQSVDIYGNIIPQYVLPFRTPSMAAKQLPGIYDITPDIFGCPMFRVIYPFYYVPSPLTPSGYVINFRPEYFTATNPMLDFSNVKQMQELIELDSKYRQYENDVITTKDNITVLKIAPTNTKEMAGFKTAINNKCVDIDKYKFKLPDTWANDKRFIFNSDTITFPKLKSLAEAFGFKITLIIDNISPDVANPIPHPITVVIVGDDNQSTSITGSIQSESDIDDTDEEDIEYDY